MSSKNSSAMEVGLTLEEFKEVEETREIINNIVNIYADQIAVEMATERYLFIMDQYQEQPHLLDPHIESLINQLLDIARNPNAPDPVFHLAFRLMYLITKTRGFKVVVRCFPHEVSDVEPVLAFLDKQDPMNFQTWETRYMLLLWLSMVCMIPFDISRLDSQARARGEQGKKPTMDRIMDMGKKYLDVSDKCRDAASYMLSRFMTRHDVRDKKVQEFLDFALQMLHSATSETMHGIQSLLGVMSTVALLFKHGKRDDLVSYAPIVLKLITNSDLDLKTSKYMVIRKLAIKLITRLGLTFLKARVATWRYQRGSRSLTESLGPNVAPSGEPTSQDEEEEYDIPDEIEDVIEHLLTGLRDKDTIVRWSAAKGIGRILGRLPKELADEVVGSVMEMFTITETDAAWHGGCLSLAELGRRGLLLPQRLPDVVPVIIRALNYDEKRGNFSVGAHVRDAACYVCWAFARAYDPEEIKPHVKDIASALVIVSVFDREVNVRRAASAAFQENVGRQGQFPNGIDIVTTCDYFAVGNMTNCYLNLSVFVAQFADYTIPLIDHLVKVKLEHWHKSVRELAAEALHNLTPLAPKYTAQSVLPELITMATSMDLSVRHGAILAAGQVTYALSKLRETQKKSVTELIGKDAEDGLKEITNKLHQAKLYRGVGGELMREAVCCLIKRLSLSRLPYHNDPIIGSWQELLDDCLQHTETDIQAAAIDALPAFCTEYYKDSKGLALPDIQESLLSRYLSQLTSRTETIRQGYSLALGALPAVMVNGYLDTVFSGLIAASDINKTEKKFAEARRDAVKALTSLCLTVGVKKNGQRTSVVCSENLQEIYDALFSAMTDYTLDSRGDVGAWVREAAMTGLHEITSLLMKQEPSLLSDDISRTVICSLIQQSSEKIDRTRAHAAETFHKLLHHSPPLPSIPCIEKLQVIFPKTYARLNWSAPGSTFPLFTKLLDFPEYRYHVLLGLTVSVGGLTESLVRYSSEALRTYMHDLSGNLKKMEAFCDTLMQLFKDNQKIDRVTIPMFKMLDQLLANGCFTIFTEIDNHSFGSELYRVCKAEVAKSGDPQKLLSSLDVFCGMLQFPGQVQKRCLSQLLIFLCHKYPIVRKNTAIKLYEAMVTYESLVEDEHLDEVTSLLSDTLWDQPVSEVRPLRNKLCDLLNVPKPGVKSVGNPGENKDSAIA